MIIRATQKKMMSLPVTNTLEGKNACISARVLASSLGQPRVVNGRSAEENQVSSTSGSRLTGLPPALACASASVRTTYTLPASSYQAGI